MRTDTRELVLDILLALERGEGFSNQLIRSVLDKYDYLDGREKAFIKRVAEGTVERQIELDYYVDGISSVPVRRMKPFIRCLIRMSAYQILFLDGVPDSAVCNEACKIAERRNFRDLKGFVNGVLRNLAKRKGELRLPDEGTDETAYLSVKYSVPAWLVELWLREYGREITETLIGGLLRIHPVSVRFRTDLALPERERYLERMRAQGVVPRQSAYLPYLYTLENVEGVRNLPGFPEGAFIVQDVSSALAVEAAGIGPEDFVIDVCAAPGGKSVLAAEKAKRVLARDVSEGKTALIAEHLERMGRSNVTVQVYDAAQTDESCLEKADVVLLDVPCSGLGVLGKKRDIKYHVSPESLERITELQRKIIAHSWQYVKPGGTLLYSTCTIHREENEEMVRWILDNFPFEPVSLEEWLPERLREERASLGTCGGEAGADPTEGCVQLLPGYMEADGFFFAKLKRKEDSTFREKAL